MNLNELLYNDLPTTTFSERLKKAKLIKGVSQKQLAKMSNLDRSTLCELERGTRTNITRDTLLKLMSILDKNILCDEYYLYILNQEENITNLLHRYGIQKLCNILKCHHSSIYRWRDFRNQLPRDKFEIIKDLD